MSRLLYLSHPEVEIDPAVPVPDWELSAGGRARAEALAASGWPGGLARIVSSPEAKAQETATILAHRTRFETHPNTAEIDRSATGYVPHERHEELADALFTRPGESAEGWETALDAQARMVAALDDLLATHRGDDLILVGHGGVGTLLWCALTGTPISRSADQPGGGHGWALRREPCTPLHPWRAFEALAADMHP